MWFPMLLISYTHGKDTDKAFLFMIKILPTAIVVNGLYEWGKDWVSEFHIEECDVTSWPEVKTELPWLSTAADAGVGGFGWTISAPLEPLVLRGFLHRNYLFFDWGHIFVCISEFRGCDFFRGLSGTLEWWVYKHSM